MIGHHLEHIDRRREFGDILPEDFADRAAEIVGEEG